MFSRKQQQTIILYHVVQLDKALKKVDKFLFGPSSVEDCQDFIHDKHPNRHPRLRIAEVEVPVVSINLFKTEDYDS